MEDDTARNGETGHTGTSMPSLHVVDQLRSPMFYLSGSPTMVAAARRALIEAGVDEHNIQVENVDGGLHSGTDR
jgi:NAD(P)H-flavin reductase